MNPIKKVVICGTRRFYIRDLEKDYHTQFGFLKSDDLKKARDGDVLLSNTNKEFVIFSPFFIDKYRKIKRGAQIIPLKDMGSIISETGISKDSKVLEAGAGSGAVTCFLAHICKKVYSYEIRDDFFKIVSENLEGLGIKNVSLKKKDIYLGISEKGLDAIIFDLPEPWKALPHARNALKIGGFLVSYSPTVPQTMDFVNSLTQDFIHVKTIEIMEREWEVEGRKVRPRSMSIGHSGFMSFVRRIR
jgi:tRNA (adenine57-N1/adenine58-N1)-methyltransferase catalytic subunit